MSAPGFVKPTADAEDDAPVAAALPAASPTPSTPLTTPAPPTAAARALEETFQRLQVMHVDFMRRERLSPRALLGLLVVSVQELRKELDG